MNSKLTLLLFCAFISQTLYSQIQNYDLNSYVRPEIKRQTLVFSGKLLNNYIFNKNQTTQDHGFMALELNGSHSAFWDKKKSQTYLNTYTELEWNRQNESSKGDGIIASNFTSRNYLKNGDSKFYWAGHLRTLVNFEGIVKDISYSIKVDPKLGIGYGRTNVISDVWHTIQMIKTLQKEGYIEQLSHEKITELANKVTEIRNMRVLDFRMSRIAQLDAIAQAMEELGIVNNVNYQMAHRLQDAFIYEGFTQRLTGWRIEGGIGTQHVFDNDYNSNSLLVYSNFYKSKALTQNTQLTYRANATYFAKDKALFTSVGVDYGWYPNARTNLTAGVWTQNIYFNKTNISTSSSNLNLIGNFGLNYFVSPQFQFRISLRPRVHLFKSNPPIIFADRFNNYNHLVRVNFSYFII